MGRVVVMRNTHSLADEEMYAWRDLAQSFCMFPDRLSTGVGQFAGRLFKAPIVLLQCMLQDRRSFRWLAAIHFWLLTTLSLGAAVAIRDAIGALAKLQVLCSHNIAFYLPELLARVSCRARSIQVGRCYERIVRFMRLGTVLLLQALAPGSIW
jgi:hypothetical protein